MQAIPFPFDEQERLSELDFLDILDTDREKGFDRLTSLASKIFDVPIALIVLVGKDRQWFKSHHGLEITETSRDLAFCAHTIMSAQPMVVPDTHHDARFVDHPLVVGEPHIRFYAGAPLTTMMGFRIGTLCLVDRKPRPDGLPPQQIEILQELAETVMYEIEACRVSRDTTDVVEMRLEAAHSAKQKFIRMMSHELRTPLNAIVGFSEILQLPGSKSADPSAVREYASHITEAGKHLLTLIDGLLQYASMERGDIVLEEQDVLVAHPLETALLLLSKDRKRIVVGAIPKDVRLRCDPRYVAQVLAHIIGNAVKFSAEDTVVRVATEVSPDGELVIRVVDRGWGLNEEEKRLALAALEQVENQLTSTQGGIGLGLAITSKLMSMHGGSLDLVSSPDGGTTVTLTFPSYRCLPN